jgi:hypothetical protein
MAPTGTSAGAKCKKISCDLRFKVAASATLKMEITLSFETSVKSYKGNGLF